MFQKHCSNEQLLSHLDGELAPRAEEAVREHLRQCWSCRRRAGELEDTVRAISQTAHETDYPGPLWVAETKLRIAEGRERIDRELAATPKRGMLRGSFPQKLQASAIGLALLLLTLGIWLYEPRPVEPTVAEVIALARTAEVEIHRQPTRQAFRVEFIQVQPKPTQHGSRLEIWSDPAGERSASRWRDPAGNLKHAIYRPGRGRGYIYDPGGAPGTVVAAGHSPKPVSVAELGENGLAVEQLEAGFMKWLESRQWQPLTFVPDFASFAGRDGVVLAAERVRMPNGEDMLRVSARRADENISVELLLEVDPLTYRPRLHQIRFETPHRIVHLRVIPEEFEMIPAANLPPAIFEPDYPQHIPDRPVVAKRLPAAPQSSVSAPEVTPKPSLAELAAVEIEARYAFHRVRACLGEPVEIVRGRENVHVRGIVGASERKAQLIAALADLEARAWLTHDLRTVDEALAAEAPAPEPLEKAGGEDDGSEAGATDDLALRIAGNQLPVQDQLERYFQAKRSSAEESPDDLAESVRRFAAEMVTLSGDALAEAWALRRLVETSRSGRNEGHPPRSRRRLEAMLRDHLNELQTKTGQMRRLVEPVLSESAPPTAGTNATRSANPADQAGCPGGGADILQVFGWMEQVRTQVLSLFAGSGAIMENNDSGASGRLKVRSPEQTARVLLDILPEVEAETRRLGQSLGVELPRDAGTARHDDPCTLRNALL